MILELTINFPQHSRQKLCNPVNHIKVSFNLPWRNRKHVQPLPTEFFKPRITKLVSSCCSKWSVLPEQVQGVCRISRFLSRLSLTWPTPRHFYSGLLPSPWSYLCMRHSLAWGFCSHLSGKTSYGELLISLYLQSRQNI